MASSVFGGSFLGAIANAVQNGERQRVASLAPQRHRAAQAAGRGRRSVANPVVAASSKNRRKG